MTLTLTFNVSIVYKLQFLESCAARPTMSHNIMCHLVAISYILGLKADSNFTLSVITHPITFDDGFKPLHQKIIG